MTLPKAGEQAGKTATTALLTRLPCSVLLTESILFLDSGSLFFWRGPAVTDDIKVVVSCRSVLL